MTSYRTNLKLREEDREGETFKRAAAGGGEAAISGRGANVHRRSPRLRRRRDDEQSIEP